MAPTYFSNLKQRSHLLPISVDPLIIFIINIIHTSVVTSSAPPSPIGLTHPFHIHGHDFYIVEQGKLPILDLLGHLESGRSERSRVLSEFLPSKDTVTIPAVGYAVVRVLADNPGVYKKISNKITT